MKPSILLKIILLLLIIISSNYTSFSDSLSNPNWKITFLGNASFYIKTEEKKFFFDFPYKSGAFGYAKYSKDQLQIPDSNSLLFFTHSHADHYSRKFVKKLYQKVYGPKNLLLFYPKKRKVDLFSDLGNEIKIDCFNSKHNLAINHLTYLLKIKNIKVLITGDTENTKILKKIGQVEILVTTPWLLLKIINEGLINDYKLIFLTHIKPGQKIINKLPNKVIIPEISASFAFSGIEII